MREALRRLRARPGRSALTAAGVAAACAMLGAAVTVSYGLATGFDRAAERADLPDLIARFDDERLETIDDRVRALPNVEARSYRLEVTDIRLAANGRSTEKGAAQVVRRGRRGYAVVEGRDLSERGAEVVIERGLANEWGLGPGGTLDIAGLGPVRVVGVAVAPDNVAFPLASTARVYLSNEALLQRFGEGEAPVNSLLLWTHDPDRLDETLAQARAVSFGITNLRFLTRDGVRVLVGQAAGIVIALLVAFSLIALASAVLMLGASARTDVQRRLAQVGMLRAIGFSRMGVAGRYGGEALIVAVPAAIVGLALGAALVTRPSGRLLETLNELGPGSALLAPLGACLVAVVVVVGVATAWPAWRAAGRPPAETLRGADAPAEALRLRSPSGGFGLGLRLAMARKARLAGSVAVVATATAVVLLMLALAGLLDGLRDDPSSVGKRYSLTVAAPAERADEVAAVPGVEAAAPRYLVQGADSFRLGETLKVVAFPGDHTDFEAPPLLAGRRLRSDAEVEIGRGLSQSLGLDVGGTLAAQLPSGREVRFRVVGIVGAIDSDGRVAYTRPGRLLDADPGLRPAIAVRLSPGTSRDDVTGRLAAIGLAPESVGGATTSNGRFLGVLADLLRAVAAINALVCLYALVQALALTATERRGTLAVMRSFGAGRRHVLLVLGGAALAQVALAAPRSCSEERRSRRWPWPRRSACCLSGLRWGPRSGGLPLGTPSCRCGRDRPRSRWSRSRWGCSPRWRPCWWHAGQSASRSSPGCARSRRCRDRGRQAPRAGAARSCPAGGPGRHSRPSCCSGSPPPCSAQRGSSDGGASHRPWREDRRSSGPSAIRMATASWRPAPVSRS